MNKVQQHFEDWFDAKFSDLKNQPHLGAFLKSFKEDIARPAYNEGLKMALSASGPSGYDRYEEVMEALYG